MFYIKKHYIFALLLAGAALLFGAHSAFAAPIRNLPVTVAQPNGEVLELFASGDEYYNWLHDANGFTIIQRQDTGYYVYANLVDGVLVPTDLLPGKDDPAAAGLQPYLNISAEAMLENRKEMEKTAAQFEPRNAPTTGTINNLVVFIRFSDESEFTFSKSYYEGIFTSTTPGVSSLYNYYREVSYNQLDIYSTFYPTPTGSTIISYQDSNPRAYYQPYNATTNPTEYQTEAQRTIREHTLLKNALESINDFPAGSVIDGDNDGYVDSITFAVSGSATGWSSLLWPHQWVLYSIQCYD